MQAGALVLVVGPSGAGKDALIEGAKVALAGEERYLFPRRVVTRTAVKVLEDHDSVDAAEFDRLRRSGAYALDWEAHGLCYGVPASIDAALDAGRIVVVNTSRRVIEPSIGKYLNCHVLLVKAHADVRAARLATRGRETEAEVAARLRREGAPLPLGVEAVEIDNSGTLAEGIDRFVAALRAIARRGGQAPS